MSAHTLSRLWKTRGFAPDRVLFVTYAFNFRDFHDNVLRPLLRNCSQRSLFVDVVSSCVDIDEQSDCFDYRYLAPMGKRFRLFRCDVTPLAHAKAIVAHDSRTRKTLSGFGSANLTPSGWRRNVEVWRWDRGASAGAILRMCRAMEGKNGLPTGLADHWRACVRAGKGRSGLTILGMPRAPRFESMFRSLLQRVPRPHVVRVASPYFDPHSGALFAQIARLARGSRLEIWTDRSGALTEPTHWRVLAELLPSLAQKFKAVEVLAPRRDLAWHAKMVELDDGHGGVARIVGSANFTGAAWGLGPHNLELIDVETARTNLPEVVSVRDPKVTVVGRNELARLARREEREQDRTRRGPIMLWACLRETPTAEIQARLARHERILSWQVDASFDQTRPDDERATLEAIRQLIQDRRHWRMATHGKNFVLQWHGDDDFIPCERMNLAVRTATGRCSAPIWIPDPDWSRRDANTGVPLAPDDWSIKAFLEGHKPIVKLHRRYIDPEQDDEVMEELNQQPEQALPITHVDYDHKPELMLLVDRLSNPAKAETMEQSLKIIARRAHSSADRMLAQAVLDFRMKR